MSTGGDTKLEKWALKHVGAIQWILGALWGFFIGMYVRGLA